jgi:processive 1,2-diacylglycerol beta-glucosyltransferase
MNPGRRSVLILTAGYGEGHNSAARALQAAFHEQPGLDAPLVDLFAEHAPRLNDWSRQAYLGLINRAPGLWGGCYRWLDRSRAVPGLFRLCAGLTRRLEARIEQEQPVALCCTYPAYPWILRSAGARRRLPPVFTVVTDALTINSLWFRVSSRRWYVTDDGSADVLVRGGVLPANVEVSGFPVGLAFADRHPSLQPSTDVAGRRRVLFMVNSGRAAAGETVRAILERTECALTVTAGRDLRLQRQLEGTATRFPGRLQVFGWTDRIPELLMTHHLVISKAGGATTQEAINALCPMVVSQVVPGQEEGNWELLRRNAAGVRADTPEEICAVIRRAFAEGGTLWQSWRRQLATIARPQAARAIAASVLARCAGGAAESDANSRVGNLTVAQS